MADTPIDFTKPAGADGGIWAVDFTGLTDQFLSSFSVSVYNGPQEPLAISSLELFLARDTSSGTSSLEIRFQDGFDPTKPCSPIPNVHIRYPAA